MKTLRHWAFLFPLVYVTSLLIVTASWGIAPEDAASAVYGTTGSNYDSTGSFDNNVSRPITSSDTPMFTLDGSKSFNAQLTCPSTSSFLEVSVTAFATGDLSATVRQDTNFDGILDYTYSPPFSLSGVCSNGVVSCDPGTWLNCKYYLWTAGGNFQATLQPASITDLGGCYCVNQSCGAAYSDYSPVLKDIGGGAAGAVQKTDARFSVTDAKIVGNTISYYGQDTSGCAGSTASNASSLQSYFNGQDNSGLSNAASVELLNQTNNPSSAYSNVKTAFSNSSGGVSVASCNINRVITINTVTHPVTGASTASASICVDHFLYMRVLEVGFDYHLQILDTGPAGQPHNGCDPGGNGIDGWHTFQIVTLPRQASFINFCVTASGGGCSPGPANCVSSAGTQVNVLTCGASGVQSATYDYSYEMQYKEDFVIESIDDKCTTLASDPTCKLRKETTGGVLTYSNFSPLSNIVPNSCKTFTGVDSHQVCRDWWITTREYFCQGQGTTFDFSGVRARGKSVLTTSTQTGSTVAYTDYRKDASGNSSNFQEALTTYSPKPSADCIKVCKVSTPITDTQASTSGTTASYRTSTASKNIFYKKCTNTNCQIDTSAGEALLADCACPDDFAQAASIMSALNEASKDIICSSTGGW